MPKQAKKGLHHLYLRGGMWWTKVNGVRETTGVPKLEVAAAKLIRDQRLAEAALRREGVEVEAPLPAVTLATIMDDFIAAECRPYDREKGGEQVGTKRTSAQYKQSKERVLRHLDGMMLTRDVTPATIVRLAEGIAREPKAPCRVTRKKSLAFLRRVFSWACERPQESGVRFSPFLQLTRQQRRELFPRSGKRGYIFTPEQFRDLYALAKWRRPLIRFYAHTGMRKEEAMTLPWSCVNLTERFVLVRDGIAKNGREREVPLGDVALGILEDLKPEKVRPDALVFTKPNGAGIRSLGTWWNAAVLKVWTPAKPTERRPRLHDLRKTCGTRVEMVSSHAVAKRLLGHADGDVTDTYLMPTDNDVRAALNRAARLIDGEQVGNVLPFAAEAEKGTPMGTVASEAR
jgi:integrase